MGADLHHLAGYLSQVMLTGAYGQFVEDLMAYNTHAHLTGTYADRRGAIRAAKRKLGKDAQEGLDFVILQTPNERWCYDLAKKSEETAETEPQNI